MATNYTITLTDYQVEVMTWITAQFNLENSTAYTIAQFLQSQTPSVTRPYELRFEAAMAAKVQERYGLADSATKLQVREVLGV